MTPDQEDLFRQLTEAHKILGEPRFQVSDVCAITGATPKAIEHFINPKRELVSLLGDWVNPGTGKRRRFTGAQVLKIAAAYAMSAIGFPQRWSIQLTELVARRASSRVSGIAVQTGMSIVTYPTRGGDWVVTPLYNETEQAPKLPVSVQYLDVDRLIDQTLAQLVAIRDGAVMPDFSVAPPEPEPNPYGPKANFFKNWEKDASGEWRYVGLTLEESRLLMEHEGVALVGDELVHISENPNPDRELILDLIERREAARFVAMGIGDE